MLLHYMDKYEATEIELIQFMYVVNNSFPRLQLKNINKAFLDKEIVNISQTKKVFSHKVLPLSNNEIYYGERLSFDVVAGPSNKQLVSSLSVNGLDFIQILKQKAIEKNKNLLSLNRI